METEVSDLQPCSREEGGEPKCSFRPDDFEGKEPIGRGKDSIIYKAACSKLGGKLVAVKVYNKAKLSSSKLRAIKREAAMMIYMTRKKVPNITQFFGAFQDSKQIFIVMEYCSGGDLLELLLKEGRAMHERRVCQEVAVPLLTSLRQLHALSIIHRDIKLENIFIADDGRLKLGDFGLTMSMKQELAISPVGTVEYMAPEVVALPPVEMVTNGTISVSNIKACNEKVDLWALGVTLYELLTGHLPFDGRDKADIKKNILEGRLKPLPASLSPQCIAFITNMLAQDQRDRLSAEELLQHPFVQLFFVATSPLGRLISAKLSDSAASLDQLKGQPLAETRQPLPSAAGSIGALASLPPSFSTRHQPGQQESSQPELVGPSKRGINSCDSADSLIKARHGVYGDGAMSSASSVTSTTSAIPNLDDMHSYQPQPRSPKKRLSLRRIFTSKRAAPMQETEMAPAAVEESARSTLGTTILQKVAGLFKGMVAPPDAEPSALTAANLQGLHHQAHPPRHPQSAR